MCQVGRCGRFCVRLMGCHNVSFVLWCCILFVDLKLYKYIFIVFVLFCYSVDYVVVWNGVWCDDC